MPDTTEISRTYRRIVNAWCMYDWANSAFATTIMAVSYTHLRAHETF